MWSFEQSLVDRFEECARRFPSRVAVHDRGRVWTYDRLDGVANQVANWLLGCRGEGPEPVHLLFPQGAEFVAALLGVLKAGKSYVPLDPIFPLARNRYIVEDARAQVLLTQAEHRAQAAELCGDGISLGTFEDILGSETDTRPGLKIAPQASAFIIYTSGSSGHPKGVLQSHINLVHNAWRQTGLMHFSGEDRFTCLYSPSVMGTVRDHFNALLNGAALVPFDLSRQGVASLAEWLVDEHITVFHTISSVLRSMRNVLPEPEALAALRLVILGGESVLRTDFELFRARFPDQCRLFTGLGSTETGTARQILLNHASAVEHPVLPLGYPVPDMEISLRGEDGVPVLQGEVGEIVVESPYLALEYWNKPDLTAQAFELRADGTRGFHTGDLGRMLPDGCLLHCGRKDFQVKVRGHRVETVEIEAEILRTGLATDVVVVSHEMKPGRTILVAYFVSEDHSDQLDDRIRSRLADTLPDYMVPSLYMRLDALPLTPNGKVDRRALPIPDFGKQILPDEKPRDHIEEVLVRIWRERLSRDSIGIHDDFFDLGGDSLEASLLALEIEQAFGIELPLSVFVDRTTIAQLAEYVREHGGVPSSLVPIQANGSGPRLFVVPGGYGNVLFLRHLAQYLGPDQPLFALQSTKSATGLREYYRDVEEVASTYLAEIQKVQPTGPYYLAGYSFGGYVALEMARGILAQGDRVALLVLFDTYPPGPRKNASPGERILIHARNLRRIGLREWPSYAAAGFRSILLRSTRLKPVRAALRTAGYVPRQPMVASKIARFGYLPPPYAGELTLIKARQREWYVRWDPMENWPQFVSGGLRTLEVEGGHGDILHEPHVRQVAEHLKTLLRQTPE